MRLNVLRLLLLFVNLYGYALTNEQEHEHETIALVEWNLTDVKNYLIVCIFMLAVSGIKIIFHFLEPFTKIIPESNFLLILGFLIGFITNLTGSQMLDVLSIENHRFFYILLPPIILEASFAIYHRTFAANFVGVILFAFVATILNFGIVGGGLTLIHVYHGIFLPKNYSLNVSTIWLFSSLIVAVDPVAVLAIFQEIHVDNNLYYLVFGESLLNDGVSVVLYEVMLQIMRLSAIDSMVIFRIFLAFILICFGGCLIGIIISIIVCLVTRFTYKIPLSEPILVIFGGYFSYLLASLITWSGIMSVIAYGVLQAAYGFQNITQKSLILVKRLAKILANLTESIIFLNLGVTVVVNSNSYSNFIEFIAWSLFFCLYSRFFVTMLLAFIINRYELNLRNIRWNEVFIISYGGLRGGIAFSLAILTKEPIIASATIFIVLFTILFMGFTIKPLVKLLNIKIEADEELSLFNQVNDSALEHLLSAMESIVGMKGRNVMNEWIYSCDEKYIRPILQRDPMGREEKIMKAYEKLTLTMHMASTSVQGTHVNEYYMNKLKPQLRHQMHQERLSKIDHLMSMGSLQNLDNLTKSNQCTEPAKAEYINPNLIFKRQQSDIDFDPNKLSNKLSMIMLKKKKILAMSSKTKDNKRDKDSDTLMFSK